MSCVKAETHSAFLQLVLSQWPAFALPSHIKDVCTAGKPWHTIFPYKLRCVFVSNMQLNSEKSICRARKCDESLYMLICCRAPTMAGSKVTVHFETLWQQYWKCMHIFSDLESTTMEWHRTVTVIKIEVVNINFCSFSWIMLFSFFDNSLKKLSSYTKI